MKHSESTDLFGSELVSVQKQVNILWLVCSFKDKSLRSQKVKVCYTLYKKLKSCEVNKVKCKCKKKYKKNIRSQKLKQMAEKYSHFMLLGHNVLIYCSDLIGEIRRNEARNEKF